MYSCRLTVSKCRPARTIVEYADEEGFDDIVIGSHGREGISRVLLGSGAGTVVRRGPAGDGPTVTRLGAKPVRASDIPAGTATHLNTVRSGALDTEGELKRRLR